MRSMGLCVSVTADLLESKARADVNDGFGVFDVEPAEKVKAPAGERDDEDAAPR